MKGEPCKQCGKCCRAIPCGIGLALLGDHRPCPALELHNNKRYYCGLILHTSHYVNLGEKAEWKDEFLGKMFSDMLGVGMGCCSSPEYDLTMKEFISYYNQIRVADGREESAEGGVSDGYY